MNTSAEKFRIRKSHPDCVRDREFLRLAGAPEPIFIHVVHELPGHLGSRLYYMHTAYGWRDALSLVRQERKDGAAHIEIMSGLGARG